MSTSKEPNGKQIGFKLTFKNVRYEVPSNTEKGKTAALLKDVTGYFNPGELSALMGPSGSGKTTLLDVLAGRKTLGTISGTIRFAGFPATYNFLRRYTGYVEQFDTLLDIFTVREMIMYTAELKRPVSEALLSKKAAVDAVLEKLGLEECQHIKIGSPLSRGISGGQAKRVNIGIALVSNPRVLFLDEPTSGLDSHTANEVMTVVKNLTQDGTTICTTIHSPTPYTYRLFDTLMMLIRGYTVYYGSREAATGYFEALTMNTRSVHENSEAEWITDIVVSAGKQKSNHQMMDAYDNSEMKKSVEAQIDEKLDEKSGLSEEEYKQIAGGRATVTPFWFGIKTFLKYRTSKNFRSSEFMVPRIAAKVVFVFLLSTIFRGVGDDYSADNFTNIAGLLFVWCGLPVFSASAYLPNLVLERAVFYRERNDGLYRVITYVVAKMLDEIVLALVSSIVFGVIIYYATSLQGSFAVFWAVYCGNLLAGVGIAYVIASVAPNLDAANAMLPAYASTLILFAGFMIRLDDIPNYYYWYTRLNFVQYGFSSLLINQYDTDKAENLTIRVREDDGSFREIPMLQYYSLEDVDVSTYTALIYAFFVGYCVLSYLAMYCWKHQRR